jgi:hypothetical protein
VGVRPWTSVLIVWLVAKEGWTAKLVRGAGRPLNACQGLGPGPAQTRRPRVRRLCHRALGAAPALLWHGCAGTVVIALRIIVTLLMNVIRVSWHGQSEALRGAVRVLPGVRSQGRAFAYSVGVAGRRAKSWRLDRPLLVQCGSWSMKGLARWAMKPKGCVGGRTLTPLPSSPSPRGVAQARRLFFRSRPAARASCGSGRFRGEPRVAAAAARAVQVARPRRRRPRKEARCVCQAAFRGCTS